MECTEPRMNDFFEFDGSNKSAHTISATSANCYLTDNEEKANVWIAKTACTAGLSLIREDLA